MRWALALLGPRRAAGTNPRRRVGLDCSLPAAGATHPRGTGTNPLAGDESRRNAILRRQAAQVTRQAWARAHEAAGRLLAARERLEVCSRCEGSGWDTQVVGGYLMAVRCEHQAPLLAELEERSSEPP